MEMSCLECILNFVPSWPQAEVTGLQRRVSELTVEMTSLEQQLGQANSALQEKTTEVDWRLFCLHENIRKGTMAWTLCQFYLTPKAREGDGMHHTFVCSLNGLR